MVPVRFNPSTMTFIGKVLTEGRVSTRRGLYRDIAGLGFEHGDGTIAETCYDSNKWKPSEGSLGCVAIRTQDNNSA